MIAAGLLADSIVYRHTDGGTWHVLSWEWPVRTENGAPAHERVTLLASSTAEDLAPAGRRAGGRGLRAGVAQHWGGTERGEDPNPSLTLALRDTAASLLASRGDAR